MPFYTCRQIKFKFKYGLNLIHRSKHVKLRELAFQIDNWIEEISPMIWV
jgi:hypothetical protein